MVTKGIDPVVVAEAALASNGGGVNVGIPMTPRPVFGLSKKQLQKDSEIFTELTYLYDVEHNPLAMIGAFARNRHRLSDQRYWEALKIIWIAAGSRRHYQMFKQFFSSKRPFRQYIMSPEEEAALKAMPDPLTVYRASFGEGDNGFSWTVNRSWLEDYAEKNKRVIIERTVKKSEVLAFFNRRAEDEIIIL